MEVTTTEICNIPSQFGLKDILAFVLILLPIIQGPVGSNRKSELKLLKELFSFLDNLIDFRSLHFLVWGEGSCLAVELDFILGIFLVDLLHFNLIY
jgi:hypothetical protein